MKFVKIIKANDDLNKIEFATKEIYEIRDLVDKAAIRLYGIEKTLRQLGIIEGEFDHPVSDLNNAISNSGVAMSIDKLIDLLNIKHKELINKL